MTLYLSNRDGNGKTDEEGHYKFPVNAYTGNVLKSTDLVVSEQSPQALGVKVSSGQYRIPDTTGNFAYTGWNSADANVSITTADPANPRISSIVIYVDKAASTSASPPNNPGVAKFKAVNGTAAAVPTAPNGTTIQASVGAGNPYIVLANVTVAASGTTVANAAISDQRSFVKILSNLVNTAALEDSSISTAKVQDSAVTTAKIADKAATTAKMKPTYGVVNGNNGVSRQSFPSANTTYGIVGTSVSYTSGSTTEVIDITASALIAQSAAGGQFFIRVNSTPVSKSNYSELTTFVTRTAQVFYEIPANTTITIDAAFRTAGSGGGSVCNSSGDQSLSPSYGVQLRYMAFAR